MVDTDVVICGGGLAGLSLAVQIKARTPDARVVVLERTRRPLPEATHKVGESSVELASHYYGEVLGLKSMIEEQHLFKNGLRFHVGDGRGPLEDRAEIGPAEFPIAPSYQLDRGRFENRLRELCEERGVDLREGVLVRKLQIAGGEAPHRIVYRSDEGETTIQTRWLVDASGRARLILKELDLRRPSPNRQSAAWFRVKGRIKVDELVPASADAWHKRDVDDTRWLSTVHLMGRGYWVWLIPLASGYTSVGVVADHRHHRFSDFHKPERFDAWLAEHEPVLHARLHDGRDGVSGVLGGAEDFGVRPDYSYLCERMISPDRWACVGEAAAFVDPLYSLGGDFLAMSNCYAARAIDDDLRDRHDPAAIEELNAVWVQLAQDAARTLSRNGAMFAHGDIFGAKLWWDFFNYWAFMTTHFVQRIWEQDAATLRRFRRLQDRFYLLNHRAQSLLEAWAELEPRAHGNTKPFVGLPSFPSVLLDQHEAILKPLDPEATFAKLEADYVTGRALVSEILWHALRALGPERAAEFGRLAGLDPTWDLDLDPARVSADALPRRQRRDALGRVARDMERALGRLPTDTPLAELLERALGVCESTFTPSETSPSRVVGA